MSNKAATLKVVDRPGFTSIVHKGASVASIVDRIYGTTAVFQPDNTDYSQGARVGDILIPGSIKSGATWQAIAHVVVSGPAHTDKRWAKLLADPDSGYTADDEIAVY